MFGYGALLFINESLSLRSTLPDLLPSNHVLSHTTAAVGPHPQSSFPVSVIQTRSPSPTKPLHSASTPSSSSLVGGRSPIHEMECISENQTEDSTSSNTVNAHHSPPSPRMGTNRRSSLGAESSIKHLLNYRKNSTPVTVHSSTLSSALSEVADQRQRRVGSAISSTLHARITATLENKQNHRRLSAEPTSNTTLTAYLLRRRNSDQPTTSASNHQNLLSQLQMPTFSHQNSMPESSRVSREQMMTSNPTMSVHNGQCYPAEGIYTNGHTRFNATPLQQSFPNHVQHPTQPHPHMPVEGILSHVSSVLSSCGIPFQHCDGVFTLEHQGVQLRILISNIPYSNIQLQYLAGDTTQYERVCAQLYNQLQRNTPVIPPQKVYTTYVS